MSWTVELTDLEQTVLATLDDREPGATVEIGRHTARLASVTLAQSDPAADLVSTGDTVLKITDPDWTDPVFVGRVNTREIELDPDTDTITITAADPLAHLGQKIIRVYDTAGNPDAFIWHDGGSNTQPADLMAELIADHAADAGIAEGLTPGGATGRTMTFPLGSTVLDGILSLSGMDDSVEFELTPTDAVDGTLVTFNAYYPQQGSDLTATVTLALGVSEDDNLMDFSYEEALSDLVNRHVAIGDVFGAGTYGSADIPYHLVYIAEHAASIAQYGAFESSASLSGVIEVAALTDYAVAVVAANAYPVGAWGGSLDPMDALEFSPDGDFWVGDLISATIELPQETLSLEGRVASATLTEEENGDILVSLQCEPEAATAGVSGTLYYGMVDTPEITAAPPPEAPPADTGGGKPPKPTEPPGKGLKWVYLPDQGWVRIRKKKKKSRKQNKKSKKKSHKETGL